MDIPEKIRFCSLADLEAKGRFTKWVDEWRDEISAFNSDNEIFVYSSVCPHFGGEFELSPESKKLRCRWHRWEFDLITGKCLTHLQVSRLRRYPFKKNNGHLELYLP